MKKILFIGNTPLQIFISCWIKYHYFKYDYADIIVHDRLTDYSVIKANIEKIRAFDNVIVLPNQHKKTKVGKTIRILKEYKFAFDNFHKADYDEFFFANFDFFSQRVYDCLKKNNPGLLLNFYEEGLASYSKKDEYFYNLYKKPQKGNITHNNVFVKNYIYGNIDRLYYFRPDFIEWDYGKSKTCKIDEINVSDLVFKEIINGVFGFSYNDNEYTGKYIFFEESYYQDSGFMDDVDLVNRIADAVGKENITVKIHPRNKVNRFKELGYKTNTNLVIPWEVIALNIDLSEKVLITISSSSIVTPLNMFNCKSYAFSVLKLLESLPYQLSGEYLNTITSIYAKYPEISMCNNINEIVNG